VDSAKVNLGPGPAKFRRLRIKRGLEEFNLRIIVSRTGTVNPRAEIFRHKFSPIIILTTRRATASRLKTLRTLANVVKICGAKEINFPQALRWLREAWGVKRLLCEGGGELNDALFRAGLVDEVNLTVCPKVFGGRTAPSIADGRGFSKLTTAVNFRVKSMKPAGDELFLVCERARNLKSKTP